MLHVRCTTFHVRSVILGHRPRTGSSTPSMPDSDSRMNVEGMDGGGDMMTELGEGEEPGATSGMWEPPPRDECQEEQVYDSPVGEADDILRIRMLFDLHDNLVDFAIVVMTGPPDARREVARADIRHTGLHVHWFRQDGSLLRREEIRSVATQGQVQDAYNEALTRVTNDWAEYKRRWRRG